MCLYPRLVKNPKYKPNKKNGGHVPPLTDQRVALVPIGCGKCKECKHKKAREWTVRLQEELKKNNQAYMVTLTFNNKSITELCSKINSKFKIPLTGYALDNQIATTATRLFLERWRKKYKKSIRHWLITELGHNGTENIHLHGILWCGPEQFYQLENIWSYGYICKGTTNIKTGKIENWVNDKTINYIVKYVMKLDKDHKYYEPKILTSSGIGNNYNTKPNEFKGKETNETYKLKDGRKMQLPIYYRNKAFTDEEKEKLWLKKLDDNIRYINGIKIDISKEESTYYKILKKAQEENIKLGYDNGKIEWSRYDYEQERRKYLQNKRIKNTN